jgi:hypothetical protein
MRPQHRLVHLRLPYCGAAMIIIETFARGQFIRGPPPQRAAA